MRTSTFWACVVFILDLLIVAWVFHFLFTMYGIIEENHKTEVKVVAYDEQ